MMSIWMKPDTLSFHSMHMLKKKDYHRSIKLRCFIIMLPQKTPLTILNTLYKNEPQAVAWISGNKIFSALNGVVKFYSIPYSGIIIEAELFHLPDGINGNPNAFFAFHIHENGDCSNSFQNTGSHYNPGNESHPYHAGDMPPLMSNHGYAWMTFYDARITVPEILNKSIVIHRMPDDFTTQPAGNAGDKIACGIIVPVEP